MTKFTPTFSRAVLLSLLSIATFSHAAPTATSSSIKARDNDYGFGLHTCLSLTNGKCTTDGSRDSFVEGDQWGVQDGSLQYDTYIDLRKYEQWTADRPDQPGQKYDGTFFYFTLNGRPLYQRETLVVWPADGENCGTEEVAQYYWADFNDDSMQTQHVEGDVPGACISISENWQCDDGTDCSNPNEEEQ